MPCHDILIETGITQATYEQIRATSPMWKYWISAFPMAGSEIVSPIVRPDGTLAMPAYSYGISSEDNAALVERYKQTYLATQIFAALEAEGYEMHAIPSPDHEGTWVITAKDVTRNATIGVTVYRTLEFEIDFLDALHDDSVWLAGGEFGRVIERIRSMGLTAEIVKLDVDEEKKRQFGQSSFLLA